MASKWMFPNRLPFVVAIGMSWVSAQGAVEEPSVWLPDVQSPEPNPPVLIRETPVWERALAPASTAAYSIGEPTDEEQLYVEFINRSRAYPQEEAELLLTTPDEDIQNALEFFKVDRELVRTQYRAIAPVPPVSIHPQLTTAARAHSADMFQKEFQGHTGSNGSTIGSRVTAAGYRWNSVAENVFSYAKTVPHGHAGFDIDWGDTATGIQDPPGHRNTIHNATFREVGVGVVLGTKGSVGPQLVTQEFAMKNGAEPFITGVVYYDFNGNQFYDPGEGIGGAVIRIGGSSRLGISARSGGYSVPVPGNGQYEVSFEVRGMDAFAQTVTVSGGANVKVDHRPKYGAPIVAGPAVAKRGRNNAYTFSTVGGATSYEWRSMQRQAWSAAEGGENGLGGFEAAVSSGYEPINTSVSASGKASYHLAHPAPPVNQYLTLKKAIQVGSGAELTFKSRLATAASDQVARFQVTEDGGATWTDLWTQAGKGSPGEGNFSAKSVGLGAYAGKTIGLRLAYTFVAGSFFPQTHNSAGWFIDDILVSPAEELSNEVIAAIPNGESFAFNPTLLEPYQLQVRAKIGDRTLAWGPSLPVTVEEAGPEPAQVRLASLAAANAGGWELKFQIVSGDAGTFVVEGAAAVSGPWSAETGATIQADGAAGSYRVSIPASGADSRYFRIQSR